MNSISLKSRLLLLAGSLIFFIVILSGLALYGQYRTNDDLKTVYNDRVVPMKQLKTVSDMYAVNIVDTSHKVRNGNIPWEEGIRNINEAKKRLAEEWKAYTATFLIEDEKKLIAEITPLMQRADALCGNLLAVFEKKEQQQLDNIVTKELYSVIDPVTERLDKLVGIQQRVAKEKFQSSDQSFKITLIISIIFAVAALVWGVLFGTMITRSVLRQVGGEPGAICELAESISKGDLTIAASSTGNKETGILLAMRVMAENLKDILFNITTTAASVGSGSDQLSASSEEISRNLGEQSSRSTQIAGSTEEMSRTVVDIARNASNMADSATDTEKTARKGAEVVEKSIHESREIAGTVKSLSEVIRSLGDKSEQIGQIIGVVRDIADQTNLLALNAAIEAARAGEHGRGFAVVADEVRKLAERTGKATLETSDMIESIQGEVRFAISSMDEANKKVESGLNYTQEAGEQLGEIVKSVQMLRSIVDQIAASIEEMSVTSECISSDIQGIANGSNEMSAASEQIAASSVGLVNLAAGLNSIVRGFKVQ